MRPDVKSALINITERLAAASVPNYQNTPSLIGKMLFRERLCDHFGLGGDMLDVIWLDDESADLITLNVKLELSSLTIDEVYSKEFAKVLDLLSIEMGKLIAAQYDLVGGRIPLKKLIPIVVDGASFSFDI
jgi:hypothetical protein